MLAYILLGVLVGIALLVWVRPHWRDLETLRLAAQRFGDGDLSSRTRISDAPTSAPWPSTSTRWPTASKA